MNTRHSADPDAAGLRLLAEFRQDLTGVPADTEDRMRHTVLNATLHSQPAARNGRIWRMPVSRRTMLGSTAALALTGIAGSAVVAAELFSTDSPHHPATGTVVGTEPGAAGMLELTAQKAGSGQAFSIAPGQYVYQRTHSHRLYFLGDVRLQEDTWRETWLDPQGMFPVRMRGEEGINRRPLTDADRAAAQRSGLLDQPPQKYDLSADDPLLAYAANKAKLVANGPSLSQPTPEFLATLPTDPHALLDLLRSGVGGGQPVDDAQVFERVGRLFRETGPALGPQVQAALYRAVAKLPGLLRVEGQVELAGYTGIAIAYPVAGKQQHEIILHPKTFAFIGTRSNAGQIDESWTVVVAWGITNSVGQVP
ncbi:MAG TPA: CU044_5270 family protein [Candidatus Limnocylindrales bacterium]